MPFLTASRTNPIKILETKYSKIYGERADEPRESVKSRNIIIIMHEVRVEEESEML